MDIYFLYFLVDPQVNSKILEFYFAHSFLLIKRIFLGSVFFFTVFLNKLIDDFIVLYIGLSCKAYQLFISIVDFESYK